MIKHNGVCIIAVDHGYGNIKIAETVTPAGIIEYTSEPVFKSSILVYKGKYYRIGERQKEFNPNKVLDSDYYLLTLMAIARELKAADLYEAKVHLACGLPLAWVRSQRDEFREYLMSNPYVEFNYEGDDFAVDIVECSIFPQGYSAIVQKIDEYDGVHMVADIGNGTLNIMYIVDKMPQEERFWTEKYGVSQCMNAVKSRVFDEKGVQIDNSIIERVFRFGLYDVEGIGDAYLQIIKDVATDYVTQIFRTLRKYEYTPDLVKLHFVGGGACLVKNFGDYDANRVEVNEDVCATAKGYEYLAQQLLLHNEAKKRILSRSSRPTQSAPVQETPAPVKETPAPVQPVVEEAPEQVE
jgi:plasmid segregation protein ParM